MKNISKEKLSQMLIPDIPIAAQRDFAARISKVNDQRDRLIRALDVSRELRNSIEFRAFTHGI
jgi:hypothetical protein